FAALLAVILITLEVYKRQILDIIRQMAFLKEYDSNLLITRQMDAFGIREMTDELNEMLELQREQRRRYLKKEQDISDAYTNLSHDIRTPLTSLDGYFQLLRDSKEQKERERYLKVIRSEEHT